MRLRRVASLVFLCSTLVSAGCGAPEDPARTALRERLLQDTSLSAEELDRLRGEVVRSMGDQTFVIRQSEDTRPLDDRQRAIVFGMLSNPAGVFDEGLHADDTGQFRVLNAPGESPSSEIDVARRLFIDVDTMLPRRFEFTYGFPHPENYQYELTTAP